MTDETKDAVERVKRRLEAVRGGHGFITMSCADLRTLFTDHAKQAEEIGRLKEAAGGAANEAEALAAALKVLGMSVAAVGVLQDIARPLRAALTDQASALNDGGVNG